MHPTFSDTHNYITTNPSFSDFSQSHNYTHVSIPDGETHISTADEEIPFFPNYTNPHIERLSFASDSTVNDPLSFELAFESHRESFLEYRVDGNGYTRVIDHLAGRRKGLVRRFFGWIKKKIAKKM